MSNVRTYNYDMGFKVNGTAIPDPSGFSGKDSALDASGDRDASGLLHRDMVATKQPLKIEWAALDWTMISTILPLVSGESFQFTFPDPNDAGGLRTMTAYAGDRDWDVQRIMETGEYVGKLSFSVIEF